MTLVGSLGELSRIAAVPHYRPALLRPIRVEGGKIAWGTLRNPMCSSVREDTVQGCVLNQGFEYRPIPATVAAWIRADRPVGHLILPSQHLNGSHTAHRPCWTATDCLVRWSRQREVTRMTSWQMLNSVASPERLALASAPGSGAAEGRRDRVSNFLAVNEL